MEVQADWTPVRNKYLRAPTQAHVKFSASDGGKYKVRVKESSSKHRINAREVPLLSILEDARSQRIMPS
ncbi:conserved hypothetical protein [Coccidioides posadasii str. Silveira]|uniref:Uncharacterized protein n=1 Tax=Coccidioides posadasii (strain RMSCC 757 / Silveira) TaxID=443226 RepID=E9D5W0_COCPS|nr:conserved hypothetical protein [Coccidioides posadasii str. Silveira]